jgi:hypothetical protein
METRGNEFFGRVHSQEEQVDTGHTRHSPIPRCRFDRHESLLQLLRTFSTRPCVASFALISLCLMALKMIKADLNRLGASGAFLYLGALIVFMGAIAAAIPSDMID